MVEHKCLLKGCDGTLSYYDGALGYEAMVCGICETHYLVGTHQMFIGEKYVMED